jgi:hypothetical protein
MRTGPRPFTRTARRSAESCAEIIGGASNDPTQGHRNSVRTVRHVQREYGSPLTQNIRPEFRRMAGSGRKTGMGRCSTPSLRASQPWVEDVSKRVAE